MRFAVHCHRGRRRPRGSGGRARPLHLRLREGLLLPHERSRGLRELPRHERAVRRLGEEEPPRGGGLQRLPRAARPRRQVRDEGRERLLALLLLHDAVLRGADPRDAGEPRDRRGQLPALPRPRRPGDGDPRARGLRGDLLHPVPRLGRAPRALRDERRRREVMSHG